ncbi:hypothetical protein [Mycobacterium phage WXIN]|nr:hypothetical protein [Mycobacterium phage WXIN]
MRGILVVVLMAIGAFIFAPSAGADVGSYIMRLDSRGVLYEDTAEVVETGKATCHHLRKGISVGGVMGGLESLGYTLDEQVIIISAATHELCPDQVQRVVDFGNGIGT